MPASRLTTCWAVGVRDQGPGEAQLGRLRPWIGTCHAQPVSTPNMGPPLG